MDALRGSFTVPENRAVAGSRMIPIKYVRLAATGGKAGPPIVYLAGGPGGSGIEAINYRYRMFMEMRKHGDVIALDQRGTGDSNVAPECRSRQTIPSTTATTDRRFAEYYRDALGECLAFWRQEGVDLTGYNTVQNARDLEALRRHLGAKRIDRGIEPPLDQTPARLLPDHLAGVGIPITLEAMPIAMDIAPGMTADHRRRILEQAKTAILGNFLDFALFFDGMAPELDLGDAFRAEPVSDVPVLVLSGTLDGRTPIENQHEAVSRLKNATMITVENAGHNLFDESSAAIQETIDLFMEGSTVRDGTIKVELPDMAPKRP